MFVLVFIFILIQAVWFAFLFFTYIFRLFSLPSLSLRSLWLVDCIMYHEAGLFFLEAAQVVVVCFHPREFVFRRVLPSIHGVVLRGGRCFGTHDMLFGSEQHAVRSVRVPRSEIDPCAYEPVRVLVSDSVVQ